MWPFHLARFFIPIPLDKLEQILERNNGHISLYPPKKLSASVREKCETTGCWLFVYSPEELMKML